MMRARCRYLTVPLAAAHLLLTVAAVHATVTLRQLPLETVTAEAGRIVHGSVTDVRSGRDERGVPATWVTLDVARTVKGAHVAHLTVKQLGTMELAPGGDIGSVPGLPRYRVGDQVVLFLRRESVHGFTSPVGFRDGVYRVHAEGARHVTRGPDSAPRDATTDDVKAFLDRVEALVRRGK